MEAKKIKACLFVDEVGGTCSEGNITAAQGYTSMREWLLLYIRNVHVLTEIRPFQLGYRLFHIYLVDIGGYPTHVQNAFMKQLGNVIRGRSSRLYLFWTGETWESFCRNNPDLRGHDTCVNCCDLDAIEKIDKLLLDMRD